MGERHVRLADRLPGDGRGRQGLDDRARHVRRQSAGRARGVVQAAVDRGARPHVSVADLQERTGEGAGSASSTARTTRRSSRSESTPTGWSSSTCRPGDRGPAFWAGRYDDINAFERHLDRNGTRSSSSSCTSRRRSRSGASWRGSISPEKNWKFSAADVAERAHWDEYMKAYDDAITATSTEWAPWYVIPADNKHVMQAMVGVGDRRRPSARSTCEWPIVSDAARRANAEARELLEAEPD